MKLPDGTELTHAGQPYDPVKAHEYYLRTRKLKGRKKAAFLPDRRQPRRPASYTVDVGGGKQIKMSPQELAKQKKYAAQRVKEIKEKLTKLNRLLKEKMREAEKAERKSKENAKPDSAAEKADKARDSKKYRDEHKQELKNKDKKDAAKSGGSTKGSKDDKGESEVARLKRSVVKANKNLKVAVRRQKALASATKN